MKEYREENKDKMKEYREQNKDKMKEYREENKEKIDEHKKEYYEENKEKISEKRAEKVLCECGCLISKRNVSTHKKTNKHINFLKQD